MKKVLIITYYWPPSGGGGVQRWVKFVKYLRNFGWEPVVFTPENPERPSYDESLQNDIPENIEVIKNQIWEPYTYYKKLTGRKKSDKIQTAFLTEKKTSSGTLEKLSTWIRGNFFIPDARKFWIKPSVKLLSGYIKENNINLIVTTGPPHSAHMIGLKLKKLLKIKWVADFRDPWTNIDYYQDLMLTKTADRIHHKLEKRVLLTADEVTVISPGMKKEFTGIVERNYHVIPNGYDLDDYSDIEPSETGQRKFSLAHIGSLTKTRNPINLWKALSELVAENPGFAADLEIHNIGKLDVNVRDSITNSGLNDYLTETGYLPHNEVIREQKNASILLLLINDTPNAKLILTGKLFEYMISGTPIICIGPKDGDAAGVIEETKSGITFGFSEIEQLKSYIANIHKNYKSGNLSNTSGDISKYERKYLTSKMADVFNKLN